ncbi:MAG: hypothetical protein FJ303_11205 [Planctomycetes bacterium]|nr:hypothetical protein [Planctomycetota bacterium]
MRPYRLAVLALLAAVLGCVHPADESLPRATSNAVEKKPAADIKKIPLGKNVSLEIQGDVRRVRVEAEVCFRDGPIEHLLTCRRIKDHEAILTADIDVRHLHAALTAAGAVSGKPVQFRPKLAAPKGTTIKVFLEHKDKDGKLVRVPAQQWIRNVKSKKDFATDWVFAGSVFIPDPKDKAKPPYYAANDGDVITVVNFEGACLDVPFVSTKDNADLDFEAHTARIPALKTAVSLILEPVIEKKK